MLLALSATGDRHRRAAVGGRAARASREALRAPPGAPARARADVDGYDPGRERRAEQRARELLRSCVNDEEWEMYRDLGFIRVWGGRADGPAGRPQTRAARRTPT